MIEDTELNFKSFHVMKNIINQTYICLFLLLSLTACEDGNDFGDDYTATTDDMVAPVSEESYIKVSQTSVSFDVTAQTKTVTFSANTKIAINIYEGTATRASNSWLTVEQTSSTALSFTVTENTSTLERSARVVLTGTDATATIIVTQEGKTNIGTGDGTRANPYDCTAAIYLMQSLGADVQSDDIYLKGTISSITDVSPQYGNATFYISDGNANLLVYRCLYLGNTKFTREDQVKVGDEVVIFGKVVNYKGNTPETVQGSYIYSINGSTSVPEVNTYSEFYYEIGNESGWSTSHALRSVEGDGKYVGYYYLAGEFKFKPNKDDWEGCLELVKGSSSGGTLAVGSGSNCSVSEAGFYMIELDLPNMKYSLTKIETVGIIGTFTDWSSDVDMTYNVSDGCWEATATVSDEDFKFRANHDWTLNWGGTESNLIRNGENLSLSAGTYKFRLYLSYEGNNRLTVSVTNTTGTENGHVWADLGLSVRWATTNVGASSPEDYGDYFAWGETTTKTTYDWSTYKYCNGSRSTMTKYCTDSNFGTVDNKTTLEASDDAATANWGGKWRMPTYDELSELSTKCTWTWTTQNGINGYKVTGPNGNSIFLPAAGYRNNMSLLSTGSWGSYWSSSHYTSYPNYAGYLYFSSRDHDNMSYIERYYGQSVRPVTEP